MQGKKILCLLLVLTCLCLLPPVATANAEWPMFRHDLNNTGATTDIGLTDSAMLLWNFTTGDPIYSSPAVVEGCVFFCSRDSNIYCLNASTGLKLWNFSTGDEIFSSPAVSGGLLYVASNDGWFYCLNTSTGMPLWIEWLGWNANSCPAVDGDRVYVGSGNHDVVCFNATSGGEIWRYITLDWVQSSPAISNGVLYIASNDFHLRAINASTGEELWKTHTGTAFGSPAVYEDCLYVGSCDGYLFCVDAQNGSIRWGYRTKEAVSSSPAVANGYVYFGSQDNSVYCLNASSGEIYSYISQNPGAGFRAIAAALCLPLGLAEYHLGVLVKSGLVSYMRDGRYKRFFIAKRYSKGEMQTISLLRHRTAKRIIETLLHKKMLSHSRLADEVEITSQALTWQMKKTLRGTRFILEVNDGIKTIYSLDEASAPVLVKYLSEIE